MHLIDRIGFDPVDAGPLANGRTLEPDGSPFAATYSADELSRAVHPQHEKVEHVGRRRPAVSLRDGLNAVASMT